MNTYIIFLSIIYFEDIWNIPPLQTARIFLNAAYKLIVWHKKVTGKDRLNKYNVFSSIIYFEDIRKTSPWRAEERLAPISALTQCIYSHIIKTFWPAVDRNIS